MEVPVSILEAISMEKEKEPAAAVTDIEKETEPCRVPVSKAL